MEKTLEKLGRTTARHPWKTIGAWLLAVVALLAIASASGGAFVNEFRVPGAEAQKATDLAVKHFPEVGAVSSDAIWRAENGTLKDPAHTAAVKAAVAAIAGQPDVKSVGDPLADGGMVSPDGTTAITTIQYGKDLKDLDANAAKLLDGVAKDAAKAGLVIEYRGLVVDLASQPETSGAELVGVVAALVILLIAFGSVVAAGLPILIALVGLMAGTAAVLIAGTGIDIPALAPIVAIMLGLGTGVDYALFVITRFRQFLADGLPKVDAVGRAMATAGHAVLFAGGTVVAAILGLLLVGVPFIGGMGIAAALTVTMTMLGSLTLLPAVLGLLGTKVNALRVGRRPAAVPSADHPGRWGRWSRQVGAHRYLYAFGSLGILVVLTIPLLFLRLGAPDDGTQPESFTQHRAYETVAAQFGPGWNAPLLLVADPGDAGEAMVAKLSAAIAADPEVSAVTPAVFSADRAVAMLTVVPKHTPQDAEVTDLLNRIRDTHVPSAAKGTDARVYVGGATAFVTDLSIAIGERLPWMVLAVLFAAALLLIAMFRAPVVAIKAAVMALFSIGASFGVLVAVFQWGWGLSLIGLDDPIPIISMVPMLLFAVLFGLSMDYEVFLLSAVKEDYDQHHDAQRALQVGLDGTARVIAAAGAIMTVVFLSFVPISDPSIKMIGIGLATAVVIDVTVVRLMLVPALMSILGDLAWKRLGRSPATPGIPLPARVPEQAPAAEPRPTPTDAH